MKTVEFIGSEYEVVRTTYRDNDNTALVLVKGEEVGMVATVNLGNSLPENQAYIKDYSENSGIYKILEDAGIIKNEIGSKATGFVIVPLVELDLDGIRVMEG